jgi:hypothetical protein
VGRGQVLSRPPSEINTPVSSIGLYASAGIVALGRRRRIGNGGCLVSVAGDGAITDNCLVAGAVVWCLGGRKDREEGEDEDGWAHSCIRSV